MRPPGFPKFATIAVVLGLGLHASAGLPAARAESWRVEGRGGKIELGETPVLVPLETPAPDGAYQLSADGPGPKTSIPATVFSDEGRQWLAAILPSVPAGKPFAFQMKRDESASKSGPKGVRFETQGRNLAVLRDDRLWTVDRVDAGHKPFFFPLNGPTGAPFTRAFPMETVASEDHDHPHQRSCWFTHGNVNGVDFWSEGPKAGTIQEARRDIVAQGPVLGRLRTHNNWVALDGRKICEDRRTTTFYRTEKTWTIDFDIEVRASEGELTFHDTKEGTFGLRVASSMDAKRKPGGRITNAEGLTDDQAWGQASAWVDYVGPVAGQTVGIAVLDHPRSFRHPTTWHVRTYGLFAANPFGLHDFGKGKDGRHTVPKGRSIRFAYRVVLHRGATETIGAPALYEAYARPPVLTVRAD